MGGESLDQLMQKSKDGLVFFGLELDQDLSSTSVQFLGMALKSGDPAES